MPLKRVLAAKRSKLCVVAPSSRNLDLSVADVEEEDDLKPLARYDKKSTNDSLATNHPSVRRGLGLADSFGLELAIVVGSAIFFRRIWILHGIHLIVLRRTLRLAIAWIDYFFDAGIYEEIKRTALYIFRFYLNHTEKALSGDSMRLFFAASWLKVCDNVSPAFNIFKTWFLMFSFLVLYQFSAIQRVGIPYLVRNSQAPIQAH